jgi:ABC-2 type transport system ATP-binding protein
MIQTVNLTKRFGDILAVDRLTLKVEAGEVFGFLGPNAAGKTTTIRMLTALISPTSGDATVLGWEIGREDGQVRRQVGILTESPGLYDGLSAERNLAFFASLYEVENIPEQVERYLRMLGLWDRRAEAAGTFSKGMRQKLAIARALLHEPQALFLDEPTSGLDPEAALMVREFIASLKQEGRTIFLCTHNLDEADRLCDRIAVFNTHLLALDTPTALRRQLYQRTVVFHLNQVEPRFVERVRELPFIRTVRETEGKLLVALDDPEGDNPTIVRALVEAGADIQFVGELRRSLEDIYLKLIKEDEEAGSGNGDQARRLPNP